MGGCSAAVLRSAEGSASRSTLYRRSFRIRGPRRSRRGPSQVGVGRRDVAAYRQPPTPLPSAPTLPPFEPAQPASTRSDSSRPLAVASEAPESCFALISWATCDPAPYCPILPVRLATDVDETASMPGGFAFATGGSRNLSPPLGRSDVSYGGAPFRCQHCSPRRRRVAHSSVQFAHQRRSRTLAGAASRRRSRAIHRAINS
jgi:hypothetical protein